MPKISKVAKTVKNILQEKDESKEISQGIGEGILIIDKEKKIIMLNQTAAWMIGATIQKALGKPYHQIVNFTKEKAEKINDRFIKESINTGKTKKAPHRLFLSRKDGKKISVAGSATPLKDRKNKVIGCVIILRDLSLEQKIDRIKTEFVSVVSHQLRTPLSAIKLLTEMLINEEVGPLNNKQKSYLTDIEKSTERMIKLVKDLLNVSRLETERLQVEPQSTQLEDFIQEIIDQERRLAAVWNCNIFFQKPAQKLAKVPIDQILLRQVIHSLLYNAIRYSKRGGAKIIVRLEKRKKDFLISVKDYGIGIPQNAQAKISTKFFRTDNAIKMNQEGSGLNLYLSKRILKITGGKLWFKSELGKETTFYLSLPLGGMVRREGEKTLVT